MSSKLFAMAWNCPRNSPATISEPSTGKAGL
jgi:hypothetical protein